MSAKPIKPEEDTTSKADDGTRFQSGGESCRKSEGDTTVKPERDTALNTETDSAIESCTCELTANMPIESPRPTPDSDAESNLPEYRSIYLSGIRPVSDRRNEIKWQVSAASGLFDLGDNLATEVTEIFDTHKDFLMTESLAFLNATWTGRGEASAEGEALTKAFTKLLVKDWGEFGPHLATRLSTGSTIVTVDCKL